MSGILKGDGRYSKRKKAYFRALKRGEQWALTRQTLEMAMKASVTKIADLLSRPSPFLNLLDPKPSPITIVRCTESEDLK